MLVRNQKIRSFALRISLRGKLKHFRTKWIAIERLEEYHQSCLVTRQVYHIDTNFLSAMFFSKPLDSLVMGSTTLTLTTGTLGDHCCNISINWCFQSLDLKEISKWLQMGFNISTLNEPSFCV